MAHMTTEFEGSLTRFANECAVTVEHGIHPVHFSQRGHIGWAAGGFTRSCGKRVFMFGQSFPFDGPVLFRY